MSDISLAGKVAVVTGAGQGLGRAYALALAAAGAAVVVNDLDADGANETVERIASAGGRAAAEIAAVGSSEVAEALVQRAVTEFGQIDVMVTNAGVLRDKVLWKMSDEDFDLVIETHLRGTFTCARAAAVRMREQESGGRIVVVGSPAGQFGNFGQTNYAAAKAGIIGFTKALALEGAARGITVNAVAPGYTDTAMVAAVPADILKNILASVPVGRLARPDEIARAIVFLASDDAGFVTGTTLSVNGGKYMQ